MRKNEQFKKTLLLTTLFISPLSILPFVRYPEYSGLSSDSLQIYASTLGTVFGFIGIYLLVWQHILGNRYITKYLFTDISWTTNVHKKIGIYGTLLIFLHPLLYGYSRGFDLLTNGLDFSSEYQAYVSFGRLALFALLFIWITSAILRSKLKYRPWKYIHYLSYVIAPLVFVHASNIGSTLINSESASRVWLLLIGTYVVVIGLRLAHFAGLGQYRYKLITKKELVNGVFEYTFEPKKSGLNPKLGQFLYLRRSLLSEEHPFTISRHDSATSRITVTSKVFGGFTQKMSRMKVGDMVRIDGPYGIFTADLKQSRPSILIAGGIGITPFLQRVLDAELNKNLLLFNCNQNLDSVVRRKDLKESLGSRYIDVISSSKTARKGIETGYISVPIIQKYVRKELPNFDFYICGPPIMMDAAEKMLIAAGVPKNQIHTEKFSY